MITLTKKQVHRITDKVKELELTVDDAIEAAYLAKIVEDVDFAIQYLEYLKRRVREDEQTIS